MSVIELHHVSKCFSLQHDRARSFQELALAAFRIRRGERRAELFWALRDVSFAVNGGEAVGIVGANGSGKSTCLKMLTRILEPTSGSVSVQGRISALLELGTGFHPELTGRENIYLYGSVLGLRRREMAERFDRIVAFAELPRFIDVPVKFYSSGMYVRLAFATAINVDADVLLVDEVLSVGDQSFQSRCIERIHELKRRGVTIVFVSHSLDAVRSLCDRAVWLDDGQVRADGVTDEVVARYLRQVFEEREAADLAAREAENAITADGASPGKGASDSRQVAAAAAGNGQQNDGPLVDEGDGMSAHQRRWGTGEAQILSVRFLDAAGQDRLLLTTGEPATIIVRYRARQRIEQPMFGLAIHRSDGFHVTGPNSVFSGYDLPAIEGEGEMRYRIEAMPLLAGTYYLSASLCDHTGLCSYDFRNLQFRFRVQPGANEERYGIITLPARWEHIALPQVVEGER